jgi:hypothetical protein
VWKFSNLAPFHKSQQSKTFAHKFIHSFHTGEKFFFRTGKNRQKFSGIGRLVKIFAGIGFENANRSEEKESARK